MVQQLCFEADQLARDAGMELAKWQSSQSSIMRCNDDPGAQHVKVLGVSKLLSQDIFQFVGVELLGPLCCTKCVGLSLLAGVYDPLVVFTIYSDSEISSSRHLEMETCGRLGKSNSLSPCLHEVLTTTELHEL